MSRRIPSERGAIRTLMANHVALTESSTCVTRFFPMTSRSSMAATNGTTAVATRACGLRSSNTLASRTTEI